MTCDGAHVQPKAWERQQSQLTKNVRDKNGQLMKMRPTSVMNGLTPLSGSSTSAGFYM